MPFVPTPGRQRQTSLGVPGQPGLHSKTLSQKQNQPTKQKPKTIEHGVKQKV